MRALLAIALLVFCNVGAIAANAEDDLCVIPHNNRPAPLHYQHYFPSTGVKPKIGRAEDLSAPSSAPERGETYRRNY
jgi:hypothetical protein